MYKTVTGLILRRRKFGEAHAYITALTKEGLITFGAYGIISHKNKNFPACQPYTLSEFVLSYKGENATLSQASAISHLVRQGIDFEHLSLANYISSMASETNFSADDTEAIYSLTCTALHLIDKSDIPCPIIKAVFELRLTSALGFYPDLEACVKCEKPLDGGLFVPSLGGVICDRCAITDADRATPVTGQMISAISHMLSLDDRQAFGIRFADSEALNTFCKLAETYSLEHLECAISALNYYKNNFQV